MSNRRKKYFINLLVMGLIIVGLYFAAHAEPAISLPISAPPELDRIIDEGLSNNQSIQALEAEVQALKERTESSGALPDPKVGIAALNMPTDSFRFDEEAMTQKQIAVEQTVPWPAKLDLKSETVAQNARIKAAELASARLSLARNIAEAYYEIGYVAQSQEINAKLMDMVRRIRRDAENNYSVGKGLQQNIFQADVELSRLRDEAIMLENRRGTLPDRINALLNRATYRPVDPPTKLPQPDFNLSINQLKQAAFSANPELEGLKSGTDRARAEIKLAEKEYFPDFNFRLAYGQRDEDFTGRDLPDFFTAAVMLDVPLWHRTKQSRDVAATSHQLRSAENRYTDLRRRLPHQINTLVSEIEDTRQRYQLYHDELISQAEQWARSALDAYEVGKVPFDTMIDARIRLLRYERDASRLKFTIYQKRAALEALAGQPLTEGQTQ
ncbi:MAG: TolC family protein [Desulfobacterales bacterium]